MQSVEGLTKEFKPMGIQIRDNLYMHNVIFSGDQVMITSVIQDSNHMGRQSEE